MIGKSEPRVDAPSKAGGTARYPDDLGQPGDLVAKVVFSGRPHARMRGLDPSAALATPGVVAVLTADDVPHNEYGLSTSDQPVLIGPLRRAHLEATQRASAVAPDVSRWEGDQVAVIVAESRTAAKRASEALQITWEELPVVADIDAARRNAVLIHPEHAAQSNVYEQLGFAKGDIEAGWRESEVTIAGTYVMAHQEHAYLQPEAARSYVDAEGRITVEIAGQWAHGDREQIAHALGLPIERVRVRYPAIGGAFGGREDVSLQIVMALAAWRLAERGEHRPLRTLWSRRESIVGHGKSHWTRISARWGATRSGRITAVEASVELDAGAYNRTSDALLRNALSFLGGPYDIPNARIDGCAIYTNNVPGVAFRGFGAPQACFAVENQMNKLAAKLACDPLALRRANLLAADGTDISGAPLPAGFDVEAVLAACAQAPRVHRHSPRVANAFSSLPADRAALRSGRGFACGIKNIGYSFGFPERSEVALELAGDAAVERVRVRYAGADVGQGAHTVVRQMAAAALDVPLGIVELVGTDTDEAGDAGSSSASRITVMAGRALREAAERALVHWQRGDRPARADACCTPAATAELGHGTPHISYGAVAESVELSVDIETGHVAIQRVVCADDVGKAINPALAEGQVHGAIAQALGATLFEDLRLDGGRIVNPRLSEYLIPTIGDVPHVLETRLVETADPSGPWGARGIGEMPFLPLAAAITAALHDATGVWFDEIPLTPERVLSGLRAHATGTARSGSG